MVMTPVDLDSLSKAELKERHLDLLERFYALEEEMKALKDELGRLTGGSGRPPIKPSGMERVQRGRAGEGPNGQERARTAPASARDHRGAHCHGRRRAGGQPLQGLPGQHRPRSGDPTAGDPGAARTLADPYGRTIIAPPPAGLEGEFGPTLKRAVLALYHQGQMTSDRLVDLLGDLGLAISKREVVRILTA